MANPYTSLTAGPTLSTKEQQALIANPELMGLERQRKMAELLLAQGLKGQPEGQMVSGYYVAPSWTQRLSPVLDRLMGEQGLKDVDEKTIKLAEQLRRKEMEDVNKFYEYQFGRPAQQMEMAGPYGAGMGEGGVDVPMPIMDMPAVQPNIPAAIQLGSESTSPLVRQQLAEMLKPQKLSEGEVVTRLNPRTGQYETVAQGGERTRPPVSVGNYLVDARTGKVIFQAPEKPQAGQVVETPNGPMLVNTRTGQAQPIMADGKPLEPKLTSEQQKDILSINQQRATVQGALKDVQANKDAFSFGRGLAQAVPYGESLAGRFETPAQTQTRAYVFNNVSAVIKERAGTAQSAQELQRINSFMPAVTDNADQIIEKLKGFEKYLDDLEKGTRISPSTQGTKPTSPTSFASEADAQKAFNEGKLKAGDKITINGVSGTWK
jgi:hypothetical protein